MSYKEIYNNWLNSPFVTESDKETLRSMTETEIEDAFYKTAEFGTAGMRNIMGLGTNRLNPYMIRLAAKGVAMTMQEGDAAVIAYDTRNNSPEFAAETARVLAKSGIKVYLFDDYSPVPLLSFAVRHLGCRAGIAITASHNTKEYNGFKVYDETGCQIREELASAILQNMQSIEDILNIPTAEATDEHIIHAGADVKDAFLKSCISCSKVADRETKAALKVVYTPIHGSGYRYVKELLAADGFSQVSDVAEQSVFDGDFPTVKKPNPEDHAALDLAVKQALAEGADLVIGTDPDCDRIGAAVIGAGTATASGSEGSDVPVTYLSGNQMGALLVDFLAGQAEASAEEQGALAEKNDNNRKTMITSIVTNEIGRIIAESHGAKTVKTLTGFKYIGAVMNGLKPEEFLMGYEESYGYLVGMHARDKDAVSAAMLICEMAAYYKAQGKTLTDVLEELYHRHGYWMDAQDSYVFEGASGAQKMQKLMEEVRTNGATIIEAAGEAVKFSDYSEGIGELPRADILQFQFDDGSWIIVRPSGTEPKIKVYYCLKADSREKALERRNQYKYVIDGIFSQK